MRLSYSSGMKLTAVIQKDEKMYVAKCPEIGTVSQGRTVASAIKNLKEATELYLEEFPDTELKGAKRTIIATFEVAEVAKA
jgi:predicted RNase H-like HicB family nuclease